MADVMGIIHKLLGFDMDGAESNREELQQMLDTFLAEARQKRGEVYAELVEARAELLVLQRRKKANAEQARKWGLRAENAVAAGQDEAAREHLRRQRSFEEVGSEWDQQVAAQENAVRSLEKAARQLAGAMEEAETRMAALVSRHKAAVAAARVEGILQHMGEPADPHPAYRGAELSVDAEEAWARALAETTAASVEKRLHALEHGEEEDEIEKRLNNLRQRFMDTDDDEETGQAP